MGIEQTNVIDAIGTDNVTGAVHLTIADHLEWSSEHMLKLQEKINSYLAFVEGGEIYSTYPDAEGRAIVFALFLNYRPNIEAASFLEKVRSIIETAGFTFYYGPVSTGYTDDNG